MGKLFLSALSPPTSTVLPYLAAASEGDLDPCPVPCFGVHAIEIRPIAIILSGRAVPPRFCSKTEAPCFPSLSAVLRHSSYAEGRTWFMAGTFRRFYHMSVFPVACQTNPLVAVCSPAYCTSSPLICRYIRCSCFFAAVSIRVWAGSSGMCLASPALFLCVVDFTDATIVRFSFR